MKFDDLKTGDLVHWVADRRFQSWDIYGRVTDKTADTVRIIGYDDFKVSELHRAGEAIGGGEITIAQPSDVEAWVISRKLKIQIQRFELETEFKSKTSKLNELTSKYTQVLVDIFKQSNP